MNAYQQLQSAHEPRPGSRIAYMARAIKGKFTTWRKGEKVFAHFTRGDKANPGFWSIKKDPPKGKGITYLAIMNECCGIPRNALTFPEANE